MRLDADILQLHHLASNSDVFGTQAEWGDIMTRRYDKLHPIETHKAHTTSTGEPVVITEVSDIEGMRSYIPHCGKIGRAHANRSCDSNYYGGRRIRGNSSSLFEHDIVWAQVRTGRGLPKNREGWNAVFRRRASDVDNCNCHPSLARILLKRAYAPDNTHGI